MTHVKAQSALLVPQIRKSTTTPKPHTKTRKVSKYSTNCGWNNHNVNMCGVKKKKEPNVVAKKVTI